MNMTEETEVKKYRLVIVCEVCGEPLKLVRVTDDDGWLAECSDLRCGALHQGSF